MKRRWLFLVAIMCSGTSWGATCPTGTTPSLAPSKPGYGADGDGECRQLCLNESLHTLNTSTGHISNIFASARAMPALGIKYGDSTCYVDLVPNTQDGSNAGLNIAYNDSVYHTLPATECYETYTLSYDCGAGASGVGPESVELHWGDLFAAPYGGFDNTCTRRGYKLSGWAIDGNSTAAGTYAPYTYAQDETAVATWTPNEYTAYYDCGVCHYGTTYQPSPGISNSMTVKFGEQATVQNITCANATGLKLDGYGIYTYDGELGQVVQPGQKFEWTFPYNAVISPIFADVGIGQTSTATFSCGDGATGIPPKPRRITYGELIFASELFADCKKPGYYINGIVVDGTVSGTSTQYAPYPTGKDAVVTPNWVPNAYTAYYDCGVCQYGTTYQPSSGISKVLTVTFGDQATVQNITCANTSNLTASGYGIYTYDGELGQVVQPGQRFEWTFPYNAVISPIYGDGGVGQTSIATFSCGDGATGTPPAARRITYGELIFSSELFSDCKKTGYHVDGIVVDGTVSGTSTQYASYPTGKDAVVTPNWVPNAYTAYYDCGVCQYGTTYQPSSGISKVLTVTFGDQATVQNITCANTSNLTASGYGIYTYDGELGRVVQPGQEFEWTFPYNAVISPIYSDGGVGQTSTATFSCGDGATGTPPAARRITYGELIFASELFSNCKKPGYYINGIVVDDTVSGTSTQYAPYPTGKDAVVTPNWAQNEYTVYYDCSAVKTGAVTTTTVVHYGDDVVASATCGSGITYRINVATDDTNTVTAGDTFLFKYTTNIVLSAIKE